MRQINQWGLKEPAFIIRNPQFSGGLMMRFRVVLHKALLVSLCLGLFVPNVRAVAQEIEGTLEKRFEKAFREGERLFYQGDFEAAKGKFREAFLISEKISGKIPDYMPASSLKMEGLCYQYLDELGQALALFHEALRLGEQLGLDVSDSLNVIGWARYLKGEYTQALEYLQKAEVAGRGREGVEGLRGRILIETGVVYSALGNYSLALKHLLEGLEQIKTHEAQGGTGNMERTRALQHLGDLERSWGNSAKALEHYEDAVRIGREASQVPDDPRQPYNRAYLVEALNELGALYGQLRRYDQAQAAFKEALDISGQLRTRRLIAGSLTNLGNLARDQSKIEQAIEYHQRALSFGEEASLRPIMGLALTELGWDWLWIRYENLDPNQSKPGRRPLQRPMDRGLETAPTQPMDRGLETAPTQPMGRGLETAPTQSAIRNG